MSASGYPGYKFPKHVPVVLVKADKDRAHRLLWERRKREVKRRDKYICGYCGGYTAAPPHHIVPKSLGGSDDLSNLATLCLVPCHQWAQKHIIEPDQKNANKPMHWTKVR